MTTIAHPHTLKGGAWLTEGSSPSTVFTPEKLTDEHKLIGRTAAEFVTKEVLPVVDRLENKDWALNRELMVKCGSLGLLGADVPEAYGGVDLDKMSALVVSEQMGRCASFSATFGAQGNLTIAPLCMFGTEAQKARYLPGLVAGEILGAYCLSESGSGSDALAAKCRATRDADGSFVLSGEKMWITCGGFADLYVVFAKVDGSAFTAFLVERAWPGVSTGKEEHKMGLHGSSTTPVILHDVRVPADAVLGAVGKGHIVAFNVLNLGRLKLGAMCSGGAKAAIAEAARYAAARKQFGVPIASFGAIKHKLGEMTAREYALESIMYRTAGMIDAHVAAASSDAGYSMLKALEEFAVEASIAKVHGSEVLDYVVDENVQIHGGNGFVKDYPAERRYRDARVNRIFEGTNEINRFLIPGILIKRAGRAGLSFADAARALRQDAGAVSSGAGTSGGDELAEARRAVDCLKQTALLLIGAAVERYGESLQTEQEVASALADVVIDAYAAESSVLRASAASDAHPSHAALHADAARACVFEALGRVELAGRHALAAMVEGEALDKDLVTLRALLNVTPTNTVVVRRRLADATVARRRYVFSEESY